MNYINLINRFWQCDMERPLTANDTRLYMYLLHTCNALGWKNPFRHSDRHLSLRLGMAVNTVRDSRNRLQQLGFIKFETPQPGKRGRGIDGQTIYWIEGVERTVSTTDTDSDTGNRTVSTIDTVPDTVPDTNIRQDKNRQDNNPPLTPPLQGGNPANPKKPDVHPVHPSPQVSATPPSPQSLPFGSHRFAELWQNLLSLPHWKKKPRESIAETLRKLAEYPEEFACELLSQAISGNYKSVVYSSTPDDYQRWLNARKKPAGGIDKTKINDVWKTRQQQA